METFIQKISLFFGKTASEPREPQTKSGAGGGFMDSVTSDGPIEDVIAKLASEVSAKEWELLPADLTDRLDDHLYGKAEE